MNATVETDPRFADTFACVEATSYEHLALWNEWSVDAQPPHRDQRTRLTWRQDNPGTLATVGHVAGSPVCASIFWDIVGGRRILFWEATSRVVDFAMIEAWIEARTPNAARRTNAMNFHNAVAR